MSLAAAMSSMPAATLRVPSERKVHGVAIGKHGWGEISGAEKDSRMQQLQEMGFSWSSSRSSLEACDWDVNRALDSLFVHNVLPSSRSINSANVRARQESHKAPADAGDELKRIACLEHQISYKSRHSVATTRHVRLVALHLDCPRH